MTHNCRVCDVELDDDNWSPGVQKNGNCICKECHREHTRLRREANPEEMNAYQRSWRENNPEKEKATGIRARRKKGVLPFDENKECSQYFGIHIAEEVLEYVFDDVIRMPMNNPGYDLICNTGKKIDVKSGCMLNVGSRWIFHIRRNLIADYFVCVAFDNRIDLNPLHIWLLPGDEFNHLVCASISLSTIDKWDENKLDINKVASGCDTIRRHL